MAVVSFQSCCGGRYVVLLGREDRPGEGSKESKEDEAAPNGGGLGGGGGGGWFDKKAETIIFHGERRAGIRTRMQTGILIICDATS
jgi:hypothetical protein